MNKQALLEERAVEEEIKDKVECRKKVTQVRKTFYERWGREYYQSVIKGVLGNYEK